MLSRLASNLPKASNYIYRATACSSNRGVPLFTCGRFFSTISDVDAPNEGETEKKIMEFVRNEIALKNAKLEEAHFNVTQSFPPHAQPTDGAAEVTTKEAFKKRLIYRSGQRGWLEVDLLLGKWAADNVPSMTDAELAEYEGLLNMDTLDIFKIVSGQTVLPEEEMTPTIQKIINYALASPLGKADPAAYAAAKKYFSN